MDKKDYYEILGVERDASPSKIKEAYRRLAFQYHPDRNRENPAAVERMKEVNEAYAVLSDPEKRKTYDTFGQHYGSSAYDRFKQRYSEEEIFRGCDIHQVFEEMARSFGFRSFDDLFREVYGEGFRSFEFRRAGVFGRGFLFYGPLFQRRPRGVPSWDASERPRFPSGLFSRLLYRLLQATLGLRNSRRGQDWEEVILIDPATAREGGKVKYFHRRKGRELLVHVPPRMEEGQKIRLRGMGGEGRNGGEPGDLYLKIRIYQPFLERIKNLLSPLFSRRIG